MLEFVCELIVVLDDGAPVSFLFHYSILRNSLLTLGRDRSLSDRGRKGNLALLETRQSISVI